MDTRHFREDHARILVLGRRLEGEVKRLLDPSEQTDTTQDLFAVFDEFTAVLSAHLEAEDGQLYPAMMANADPEVASLAKTYFDEMGGITDMFGYYCKRWTRPAVTAEPARFTRETSLMLEGLYDRIQRENRTLYPAAEGMSR